MKRKKKTHSNEAMKHLTLLTKFKRWSVQCFIALLHTSLLYRIMALSHYRFIASSLSTLSESMLKSPCNDNERFSSYVKAKTTVKFSFATKIVSKFKNFLKIANLNNWIVTSLL
jgi:hypothetical protein